MARSFDSSSSQYLTSTSLPVSGLPFSFSAWVNVASLSANQTIVSISDVDLNNYWFRLAILATSGIVRAQKRTPPQLTRNQDSTGGVSVGTWAQVGAVFTVSDIHAVLNGTRSAANVTTVAWSAEIDTYDIGRLLATVAQDYADADIAEVAIWDADIDDAQWASLAAGFSPLLVRPQNLVSYLPIIGVNLGDRMADRVITNNGSTIADSGPRIYMPQAPFIGHTAAAVGGTTPRLVGRSRLANRSALLTGLVN